MDFAVMTDHNNIESAAKANEQLTRHRFAWSLICGEEISHADFHMNAYPLKELIPWDRPAEETIALAHAQGAVIQWNHPGAGRDAWTQKQIKDGMAGTALDALELEGDLYEQWKQSGREPIVVDRTDSHSGFFGWGGRTIILAPGASGEDLAEAIRKGRVVAIDPASRRLIYGPEPMRQAVLAALAEAKALKQAKRLAIQRILQKADFAGALER
jgi:hypothetical protein